MGRKKGGRYWNGVTIVDDTPTQQASTHIVGHSQTTSLHPVTQPSWSQELKFEPSGAVFPTPHSFEKKIQITRKLPHVFFTLRVLQDMHTIVDHCSEEVSWIGTVTKVKNDLLVDEIFVLDQTVTGVTTEITEEGLSKLADRLLSQEDPTKNTEGLDKLNRLWFWGHSHVNMGTSPSGQDDSQVNLWKKNDQPYLIRAIINKHGRLQLSLFIWELGIEIHDQPWSVITPEDNERSTFWKSQLTTNVRRHVWNNNNVHNARGSVTIYNGGVYGGNEYDGF
jgi:hypothetical protein